MQLKLYEPHVNQIKIHENKAKYRVAVCGRRFGKSALAINECLARCFQLPNQICWIILPLQKQAKEIYWIDPDITRYFMPYVLAGLIKIDNSELSLKVLATNSWIRLKGSDNYEGLRGSGIDFIVWDEADDMKEQAYETIKPSLADSPNHRVLYIGTPKGTKYLHQLALKGDHKNIVPDYGLERKPDTDWQTWHYTSYDNLAWPEGTEERKQFVSYIDQQRLEAEERGDLTFFNQEYLASFDQSTGMAFKEFSNLRHKMKQIIPSVEFNHYFSIDWGYTETKPHSFAAYLHAEIKMKTEDGRNFTRVITYKEWAGNLKTPHQWAELMYKDCIAMGIKPVRGDCDPSMFNPTSDNSKPISKLFMEKWKELNNNEPWVLLTQGTRNRQGRKATLHNWLSNGPDDLPYYMITDNCKQLLLTIPRLEVKENEPSDIDTDGPDDPYDSVTYFLTKVKFISVKAGVLPYKSYAQPQRVAWTPDGKQQIGLDVNEFAEQYKV